MIGLRNLLLRIQRLHRMQYCVDVWAVAVEMRVGVIEVRVDMDVEMGVVDVDMDVVVDEGQVVVMNVLVLVETMEIVVGS